MPRSKPLAIERGRLKLLESDVEHTIDDFMIAEGWLPIKTKAESVTRGGRPLIARYYADRVYVRPDGPPIFAELKRPNARTSKSRLEGQAKFQQDMVRRGFLCYRADDKTADQIAAYRGWYWAHKMLSLFRRKGL